MKTLNSLGQQFSVSLNNVVAQNDLVSVANQQSQKVHVNGAGRTLTYVYEQLRNAAEYTEDHLLQYAIKRFYKRAFLSRDQKVIENSGEELIIELTLAGYLINDSIAVKTIGQINELAAEYYAANLKYSNEEWSLDVLAFEVEQLFGSDLKRDVFAQFVYDYFLKTINRDKLVGRSETNFEIMLFVAVHKALIKANNAAIRSLLLRRYQQKPGTVAYKHTNEMIDGVLSSKMTDKIYRYVNRRSAPFRILWRLINENENFLHLLNSRDNFLSLYKTQVENEYTDVDKRISKGIVKSVIFLIITKVLIGMAIEIPYDNIVYGSILLLPLAINLLFPPIYMVLLRFTLQLPGEVNTQALVDSIDNLLYSDNYTVSQSVKSATGYKTIFNAAYVAISVAILCGMLILLTSLGFSLLHLGIFFVFLSAASFLGFRLSRMIRELEVIDGQQSGITMLRDFFYIPFVVIGQWISEKYARVNLVAMALDMLIELPLKTILHLIRQWGVFIASKKDEL